MKRLSRKFFALIMSAVAVISAVLSLTACGEAACQNGHSFALTSTTATCTEGGTEIYTCANCGEIKTEAVEAYGHSYNKNVCERCKTALTDLSQFPESYRNEIADKLLLTAPYTVDSETFITITKLLKLYKDDIDNCENRVDKAQQALENAKNEATVRRYVEGVGWVWQADEKKVAAAEKELTNATKALTQAQNDLQVCKASYEFNCEGYAWNMAILGIKATDVSNYAVNYNLAELAALEMLALETLVLPSWYSNIVSAIKTITGIDIKAGK